MINERKPLGGAVGGVTMIAGKRRVGSAFGVISLFAILLLLAANVDVARGQSLSEKLRSESPQALAKAAREKGVATRGAVLFPDQKLGCANCHAAGNANLLGPDLTRMGDRATDLYLVESLLSPSKSIVKGFESVSIALNDGRVLTGRLISETPTHLQIRLQDAKAATSGGKISRLAKTDVQQSKRNTVSLMPDNLVDQLRDRQQFLDLIRYLSELAAAGPSPVVPVLPVAGKPLSDVLQGMILADQLQCASCHQGRFGDASLPPHAAPNLEWSQGKIDPEYLERFIADPASVKAASRMPGLLSHLSPQERKQTAAALTHFMVSLGESRFQRQPINAAAAVRGKELFHAVGCVACHSPRDEAGRELLSEQSSSLQGVEQKYSVNGLTEFLENPHAARPAGRMPNLRLTHWEALDIAHYLLQGRESPAKAPSDFQLDPAMVKEGKLAFQRHACNRCHSLPSQTGIASVVAKLKTVSDSSQGCLSGKSGAWPQFKLNAQQRKQLQSALEASREPLGLKDQVRLTMGAFNCLNCHRRGELGGVSPERDEFFHTSNQNLGPQGRLPPDLTNVGAKLKPQALRKVLVAGDVARPYMTTRMPQFEAGNIAHLVELFQQADSAADIQFAKFKDQREIRKVGAELAGNRGLNCIACHTFQQKPAQTMPALDLTLMSARLQKPWFYQYMQNPQAFNPGTVMPTFWPRGHAMRKDFLDGNANLQIEALWQYLLDGRQARTPRGLIVKPIELTASEQEAVMLRRSYPGIGKRGIGVGYPLQVNLAYDAEQMRLAMIWRGKFADPGGVWRSQGHGTVRPLARNPIRFAKGPDVDDFDAPWKVDEGRPPKHQFRGYYLDEKQRPTFMYQFDGVDITDHSMDVAGPPSQPSGMRRTLSIQGSTSRKMAFRVATGKKIILEADGVYLIDDRLRVRILSGQSAAIEEQGEGRQLRLPLELADGATKVVVRYDW